MGKPQSFDATRVNEALFITLLRPLQRACQHLETVPTPDTARKTDFMCGCDKTKKARKKSVYIRRKEERNERFVQLNLDYEGGWGAREFRRGFYCGTYSIGRFFFAGGRALHLSWDASFEPSQLFYLTIRRPRDRCIEYFLPKNIFTTVH